MKRALCLLLLLPLAASPSLAETERVITVKNREETTVAISKEEYQAGLRKLAFVFRSPSNVSGKFVARIAAPDGTRGSVAYKPVAPNRTTSAAAASGGFSQKLRVQHKGRSVTSFVLGESTSSSGSGGGDIRTCYGRISASQLQQYFDLYSQYYPGLTYELLCEYLFPGFNGGGGTIGGGTAVGAQVTGPFFKDACSKKDYVGRLDLDLSRVPASAFEDGEEIIVYIEVDISFPLPGAWKPKSDGKYAPRPIFILDIQNFGMGGEPRIQTWKGNRIRKDRKMSWGKFYYSKSFYGIIPYSHTGERLSVSVNNGENAAAACFHAVPRRQDVNGYKR